MAKFTSCLGIVVVIAAVFAASAVAGRTTCSPFNGLSEKREIKCSKEDEALYERIRVEKKIEDRVTFNLALWVNTCGEKACEYKKTNLVAGPESTEFELDATGKGQCRTAYVYNCRINGGNAVNCDEALNLVHIVSKPSTNPDGVGVSITEHGKLSR